MKRLEMAATALHSAPSENWDDDFEFQPTTYEQHPRISAATSQLSEDWDAEPPSGPSRNILEWVEQPPSTQSDNWDNDFQEKSGSPVRTFLPRDDRENWDEDFDADDDDDDEEDRTVTARSRRSALAKLAYSPPPPVPPIPFLQAEQPFPRSPTASVFSVPTSGRDSVAAYSFSSTTHLRPVHPSSQAVHAHTQAQRERRRLRKKSRPQDPQQNHYSGMYTMSSSRETVGDIDRHLRPVTPMSHRSSSPSPNPPSNRNSIAGLPSPTTRTPLLSRIGSVKKKWAVRKKRASSTPSEIILQEGEGAGNPMVSSTDTPSSSKQASTNWFFRATSGSSGNSASSSEVVSTSDHITPKAPKTRPSLNGLSPPPPLPPPFDPPNMSTPSKLIKRKSLGFVQLKPRNHPINDVHLDSTSLPSTASVVHSSHPHPPRNTTSSYYRTTHAHSSASTSDLPSDLEAELYSTSGSAQGSVAAVRRSPSERATARKSRESQMRHGSYAGLGLGRAGEAGRTKDRIEGDPGQNGRSFSRSSRISGPRSRTRSNSRSRVTTESSDVETRDINLKEKEGSRGIMGSVRRISFGTSRSAKHPGHKRTKSGVSLASVTEGIKRSLERHGKDREDSMAIDSPLDRARSVDVEMNSFQTLPFGSGRLLPPIKLSPPPLPSSSGVFASNSSVNLNSAAYSTSFALSGSSSTSTVVPKGLVGSGVVGVIATASLGRSSVFSFSADYFKGLSSMQTSASMPGNHSALLSNVPRRNSMGDLKLGELKIPARISQAQVGLRRDLGMVKEFARRVEQLKSLRTAYHDLVLQVQCILDAQHAEHIKQGSARAASPSSSPLGGNIFRSLNRVRPITPTSSVSPSRSSSSANISAVPFLLSTTPDAPTRSTDTESISGGNVNQYKHLAEAFYTINSKYKIAWECAELLIELGGGPTTSSAAEPSAILPPLSLSSTNVKENQSKKSRERAITLSGEQSKPGTPTPVGPSYTSISAYTGSSSSPNMAWRASTGRHDLNQRQLILLREMLNNSDSSFVIDGTTPVSPTQLSPQTDSRSTNLEHASIVMDTSGLEVDPQYVNREWRWGESGVAMNSTITLPSEESSGLPITNVTGKFLASTSGPGRGEESKKRRSNRLKGMSGLRDMLRSLTKQQTQNSSPIVSPMVPISATSLSISTEGSSAETGGYAHSHGTVVTPVPSNSPNFVTYGRRRAKTSYGPDDRSRDSERERWDNDHTGKQKDGERPFNSPYTASSLSVKASPRRPSLASIFRIGLKAGSSSGSTTNTTNTARSSPFSHNAGISTDNISLHHKKDGGSSTSTTDEEDWDRLELEYPTHARDETTRPHLSTIRGKSPYMQQDALLPPPVPQSQGRSPNAPQTSLTLTPVVGLPGVPTRSTRLSNVNENEDDPRVSRTSLNPDPENFSHGKLNLTGNIEKTGSVRSMPPQPLHALHNEGYSTTSHRLAMTSENIKPLLENAKEVYTRLLDCIEETKMLLI
ncbi:hypothetical protein D9757_002951 [Collybiopsis confluens]|uniref:Uncharacterized protein n=1 Tax=Collybiopsis confluens TaxID=2823264 RepID=A0A8H5HVA6_9AGAR|nr:hypothetical protein D9757_002951 [Collybiopsis confluens]